MIQEPTGDIIFSATANNIPKTSHELISKINKKIPSKTQYALPYRDPYKKCDDPDCPNCYPNVIPKPIMRPINLPEPEEELEEELEEESEPDSTSYIALLLSLLGGASYGLYSNKDSEDENV